jgi:hypothetical protein
MVVGGEIVNHFLHPSEWRLSEDPRERDQFNEINLMEAEVLRRATKGIREAAEASAGGGIVGVITGRAIYEGSLDLALAQQLCDEEINQPD